MKQSEIEVFRAGRSSRGITADHLAEVASYDCAASPIPICFGHPKSDDPAAGTISKLRAEGSRLFATVGTLTERAIKGIKDGEWLKPSFAFFDPPHESNPTPGKWAPRHLALLGAAAPGIPNLPGFKSLVFTADEELQFDGDPAEAVVIPDDVEPTPLRYLTPTPTPPQEPTVMEKTPEQIAAEAQLATDRAALEAERTAFAASVENARKASHTAIINGLVTAGKVLPTEVPALSLVFNALGGEELEFAADRKATPAAELGAFLASTLKPRVPLGEKPTAPSGEFAAEAPKDGGDAVDRAEKMAKDRNITFDAAMAEIDRAERAAQ